MKSKITKNKNSKSSLAQETLSKIEHLQVVVNEIHAATNLIVHHINIPQCPACSKRHKQHPVVVLPEQSDYPKLATSACPELQVVIVWTDHGEGELSTDAEEDDFVEEVG